MDDIKDDLFVWAKDGRDTGMGRAADAEDREQPEFAQAAYLAICQVAKTKAEVHIDDVLTCCTVKPGHYNAWGAVWMHAIRDRVIAHSGRVRPCRVDTKKHAHQYPVYRSLMYAGGE
jgi:hypothetical protein